MSVDEQISCLIFLLSIRDFFLFLFFAFLLIIAIQILNITVRKVKIHQLILITKRFLLIVKDVWNIEKEKMPTQNGRRSEEQHRCRDDIVSYYPTG